MVLLCDGRMVCGCADPYGKRVLGDMRTASVSAIWTGGTASSLRRDIVGGGSRFCGDCPLKLPLKKDEPPPARPLDAGGRPTDRARSPYRASAARVNSANLWRSSPVSTSRTVTSSR